MECTEFTFFETNARRVFIYFDGADEHNDLEWEIVGNELIVSGEWNERFTLDLVNMTATSQTDGLVYQIVETEKLEITP